MGLLDRIKKVSKNDMADVMSKSTVLSSRQLTSTSIPAINIALSGRMDGGFQSGITVFCGESRCFKSLASLVCAKAYMDKFDDSVLVFFDSELGASVDYFKSIGIDTDRVLHLPIANVEELKFQLVAQLEEIKRGEHAIIVIDSIGNLASKKEVEDAINEKSAADMSRAKALKSLCRIITPSLNAKDIPCIMVNHTYKTMELYAKDVMGGGTGILYSADTVINISRSQEKDGTDLIGWNFNLNVMKSRHSREKSKVPLTVTFEGGINKYSGLLDMALEAGVVVKPSNGWYSRVNDSTGEVEEKKWRAKDTSCDEFWDDILKSDTFKDWIDRNYRVTSGRLMSDESDSEVTIEE